MKIGLLGAARVTKMAILEPAARRRDVEIVAIASARPGQAKAFARAHEIPRFYERYEDLIADRDVDLVYNALAPNNHCRYSLLALEAGKHVLCEKPFAMTAAQARSMVAAGRSCGCRLIEAFHDVYHPVFGYAADQVASGRLGRVRSLKAAFNHFIPPGAGRVPARSRSGGRRADGSRLLPSSLVPCSPWRGAGGGSRKLHDAQRCRPGDDRPVQIPSGIVAEIETRMTSPWNMHARFEILGERGKLLLINSLVPHRGHSIQEVIDSDSASSPSPGTPPSTISWRPSSLPSGTAHPCRRKGTTRSATWPPSTPSMPARESTGRGAIDLRPRSVASRHECRSTDRRRARRRSRARTLWRSSGSELQRVSPLRLAP